MKLLQKLDTYFDAGPWPARTIPWAVYLVCLMLVGFARDLDARLYPIAYTAMCAVTCWLLWRYRHRFSELNWKFHWGAIPVGILVAVVWVALGWWMTGEFAQRFEALLNGQSLGAIDPEHEAYDFRQPVSHDGEGTYGMGLAIGWTALVLRLLGMSLVVPMFEELFIRSLLLRSFHNARQTAIGLLQIVADMPLVGDALAKTKLAERADNHGAVFTRQFQQTPLGALSISGFLGSTLLFTASHIPRDWFACVACAAAYCLLLWWTNRPAASDKRGLGPVVWAHGITNALLWVYTVTTNDWQFL